LRPGHVLVPNYHFYNEGDICVFIAQDSDPRWWRRPRPAGRYRSVVWVPGNFLADGPLTVGLAVSTHDPVTVHFYVRDALAFVVEDAHGPGTARGDYHAGPMAGVVRPVLPCETEFTPHPEGAVAPAAGGGDRGPAGGPRV